MTARAINVVRHPQVSLLLLVLGLQQGPNHREHLQEFIYQQERKTSKQSTKIHNINRPDQENTRRFNMLECHLQVVYYFIGQCKTQTADCRLQTGGKMQTEGKVQTADCRPGVKCRLRVERRLRVKCRLQTADQA